MTSIGEWAFYYCTSLTSVVIGDSVTSIGEWAFAYCTSLTSVVIGDGVTSIGYDAFYSCTSLTSVEIGDSVTSIGDGAFYYCHKLVEVINHSSLNITKGSSDYGYVAYYAIEVHTGESKIVNQDGYLFYTYNGVNYLFGYEGSDTDLVLPESYIGETYAIYQYAFYGCYSLTSVVIGDSVTSIGDLTFYSCISLTSVVIGDSVISIGSSAFANCSRLTSVMIGNSVTSIGYEAFYDCNSLTSVVIPDSVTSIGSYAFYGCYSLTSVYYKGGAAAWNQISIDNEWRYINATRYYYSEEAPAEAGNYWHYNTDGLIEIWPCVHIDENDDYRCDVCMYMLENFDFPWAEGSTTLTFEMTDHSNGQELPSGCKNWMAGETTGTASMTEQATITRNEAAYQVTKLTVRYTYLPDNDPNYSWSKNHERINTNQSKGIYSDMYCNFVYDLMGASLLGCFANLKTQLADNYFEFVKAEKADIYNSGDSAVTDQEGYMYEYMTSLSIDENKMYLLASDYFIDLIRAFYCVPVNVAMLNDLAADDVLGLGRMNTVTDFANAVLSNQWTYDLLLQYCAKFGDATVASDKKGFAIAQHSLSAAGLLYTSSVRLFTDERKLPGNFFTPDGTNTPYSYAEANDTFYAFAEALERMVASSGVVRFTKNDTIPNGWGSNLLYIREQFTNHKVLFGGVILLGSLEFWDYQNMKTGDGEGFMVVPVPLYTDYNPETNDVYNTQIHNVGRIGAISAKTTKFSECSAFLNSQSTHSRNVIKTYYKYDLLYSVVGGDSEEIFEANKDMLNLMRDSVRSGFEKAYEDASALFSPNEKVTTIDGETTFINLKWHDILDKGNYQRANTIRTYYSQLKPAKETCMGRLFNNGYTMLPA